MEVLTQKITSTIVGSSEVKSGQFSIDVDNFTHITKLLSKSLYSNPIRTLMIEYVQNAIDSHTNIKSNKKIIVTLPSEAVPYYNVQDFGEGMSQEFVIDKLTKYGTSTKNTSNILAGGFGIGFKASAIYCDNFTMIVNYNGIKSIYDITNHEGSGSITLLEQEKTTECNGTTIKIPIESKDFKTFFELYNNIYAKLSDKLIVQTFNSKDNITKLEIKTDNYINISDTLSYTYEYSNKIRLFSKGIFITSYTNLRDLKTEIYKIYNNCGKLYFNNDSIEFIEQHRELIDIILSSSKLTYATAPISIDIEVPIEQFELTINRESFICTDEFYMFILQNIVQVAKTLVNNTISEYNTLSNTSSLSDIAAVLKKCPLTYFSFKVLCNLQYINGLVDAYIKYVPPSHAVDIQHHMHNMFHHPLAAMIDITGYNMSVYNTSHINMVYIPVVRTDYTVLYAQHYDSIYDIDTIIIDKSASAATVRYNRLSKYVKSHIPKLCECMLIRFSNKMEYNTIHIFAELLKKAFPEKNIIAIEPITTKIPVKDVTEKISVCGWVDNDSYMMESQTGSICGRTKRINNITLSNVSKYIKKWEKNNFKCAVIKLPKNIKYTSNNIISILQQYIQKPLNCNIDNISTDIRLLCKYISNLINSSFIILPYNSDIPETHSFKDAFKLHDHSTWILYNIRQYQNYGLIYDMIFTRTFFDEWKDDAIQLINLIFKPFDIDYSDYVTFKRFINVFKCSDITIFDKNQKQYMDLLSHVHMFNKHSHNVKEQITRIGKIVKMIQNSIFKR